MMTEILDETTPIPGSDDPLPIAQMEEIRDQFMDLDPNEIRKSRPSGQWVVFRAPDSTCSEMSSSGENACLLRVSMRTIWCAS